MEEVEVRRQIVTIVCPVLPTTLFSISNYHLRVRKNYTPLTSSLWLLIKARGLVSSTDLLHSYLPSNLSEQFVYHMVDGIADDALLLIASWATRDRIGRQFALHHPLHTKWYLLISFVRTLASRELTNKSWRRSLRFNGNDTWLCHQLKRNRRQRIFGLTITIHHVSNEQQIALI